jgi:hypothetical protein
MPELASLIYTALLALGSPAASVWISPKQSVPAAAIDADRDRDRDRTSLQSRPLSSTLS